MKKYRLVIAAYTLVAFVAIFGYGYLLKVPTAKASFSYYRTITIDHNKVASSTAETYTNFPVLFSSSTISSLKTTANGGNVQNSSGYDIGFYTNSNCSTGKMNWEVEKYASTTGETIAWVKNNSLSTSTDTTLYLCYGDSSISTDQSTATSTWNSNYKAVWHFPNGTTLSTANSTSNSFTPTTVGTLTPTSTGAVDGAFTETNSGINYLSIADSRAFDTVSAQTVSVWVKSAASPNPAWATVVNKRFASAPPWNNWIIDVGSGGTFYEYCVTNTAGGGPTNGQWCIAPAGSMDTNLKYLSGTYDGSTVRFYINGLLQSGSLSTSISIATSTNPVRMGNADGGSNSFVGMIDEVRLSDVARSADWIKTEYNNQSSPNTFYTIGAETAVGGGGGTTDSGTRIIINASTVIFNTPKMIIN